MQGLKGVTFRQGELSSEFCSVSIGRRMGGDGREGGGRHRQGSHLGSAGQVQDERSRVGASPVSSEDENTVLDSRGI